MYIYIYNVILYLLSYTKPIMFTWDIQIWGLFQAFQGTRILAGRAVQLSTCEDAQTADGMNSGAKLGKTYADYK
jgi:hypothetical protein